MSAFKHPSSLAQAAAKTPFANGFSRRCLVFSASRRFHTIAAFLMILLLAASARAQVSPGISAVRETDEMTISETGDGTFSGRIRFPTEAAYSQLKQAFPNPYVLMRNILGSSGVAECANPTVAYDDLKRAIELKATVFSSAVHKRNRWQAKIGKNADMLFSDNRKCIFMNIAPFGNDSMLVTTANLNLPEGARNVKFDANAGVLNYTLDRQLKKGTTDLEVDLKAKPRHMSALYKVFGNEEFANGIYWAAKTVFTNNGTGDITNLKVSYRVGDYAPWCPDHEYSLLPAGGHIVDLYYPLFKKEIAELKSATPADLEVKFTYNDSSGKACSDTLSKRVTILGSSQFEYSNLTEEERTSAWSDLFSQSPLVAAFVTKMDAPVRQFAGMVAQACGGEPAGASDKAALAFLQALYELERFNGIAYQWSASFLIEYAAGQELKYPRDVLRDKSGTCIELAILFAAVCESSGLKSFLVLIPGHCFPIIKLRSGQMLPIECTGISGAAVGERQSLSFEDAVKFASQEVQQMKIGRFYIVDVGDMQRQGVLCPEMPALPADVLQTWGYKVPSQRLGPAGRGGAGVQQQSQTPGQGLSGEYPGAYRQPGGTGNQMSIVFASQGNQFTGEVTFVNEATGTCSGTVNGKQITFTCQMNGTHGQFAPTFQGQIQGSVISGSWALQATRGTFQLSKTE